MIGVFKQMELEYSLLNTLNNSVEQKAYAMIGAIGIILTIQSSVIIYLYPFKCYINLNLVLLIIIVISSLAHVLSIWLFLRNLHVKDYEILLQQTQLWIIMKWNLDGKLFRQYYS